MALPGASLFVLLELLLSFLPVYFLFIAVAKIFFQCINFIQMLPWKIYICTAKVTISCCLFVDWTAKVKHLDDTSRTKIKVLTNNLDKLSLRKLTCSESINTDRSRMSNTDRIGKLDLALVSKTCCNDVLGNITSCISCRTVNLCAVLTFA